MKICIRCSQSKPEADFNKMKKAKDGLFPWCRECKKAYEQTPESQARRAKYYKANRAWLLPLNRKWELDNPERRKKTARESKRKRYQANPEKFREYDRKYRKANPDKYAEWDKAHRVKRAGAPGKFTHSEWLDKLSEFNYHCAYCLVAFSDENPPTQDHMLPLVRGGTHDAGNIVPACRECNSTKRTRTPLEFLAVGHLGG